MATPLVHVLADDMHTLLPSANLVCEGAGVAGGDLHAPPGARLGRLQRLPHCGVGAVRRDEQPARQPLRDWRLPVSRGGGSDDEGLAIRRGKLNVVDGGIELHLHRPCAAGQPHRATCTGTRGSRAARPSPATLSAGVPNRRWHLCQVRCYSSFCGQLSTPERRLTPEKHRLTAESQQRATAECNSVCRVTGIVCATHTQGQQPEHPRAGIHCHRHLLTWTVTQGMCLDTPPALLPSYCLASAIPQAAPRGTLLPT